MIQFNLLPDVKVAYLKAKKAKRIVIVVASISVVISVTLLAVTYSAVALQNKHIKDLSKDISSTESSISGIKDVSKILTIQSQLNTLPGLYQKRPISSRLYDYVQSTTPTQVSITKLDIEFDASTLEVEGTADTLESVNTYIDTLKFTTFTSVDSKDKTQNVTDKTAAFTNVVLTSFNRDTKTASYKVDLTFNPIIFNVDQKVTLNVPKTITTRSETELPGNTPGVFDSKGTTK